MEQQRISVVINTYNAQRYLPQVLDSVRQFDEVLICDMESTDSTLEIAKTWGCRIVTFPRKEYNIVEPARDFAIHQALYEWVLIIDADEQVTAELHNYLYEFIVQPHSTVGLKIPHRNHFMGCFMHSTYPDYHLRFFCKDLCYWPPVIHSQPQLRGAVAKIPQNKKELAIIHLPNEGVRERMEKINRYTDNEVQRRKDKHYGWIAFFYRPAFQFIKRYFIKGGFRDGYAGFIYALLDAVYQIVMLSKLKESHP